MAQDLTDTAIDEWRELGVPPEDLEVIAVGLRLLRTAARLKTALGEATHGTPLRSRADYETVAHLRRSQQPVAAGELASALALSSAGMTGRLDYLERHDLLTRSHSDVDRRAVLISLTPSGRDVVDAVRERTTAIYKTMLHELSEAERPTLEDLLRRLDDGIARSSI